MQDQGHAALGIGDPRAKGALAFHTKRPATGFANGKHRVVVDHQHNLGAALAFETADDHFTGGRWCSRNLHIGAQRTQSPRQLNLHQRKAFAVIGAGVQVDQSLHGLEYCGLFGHCSMQCPIVVLAVRCRCGERQP